MPVTHTQSIYGPEIWVHLFRYAGRQYRLYKRDQAKEAPWHFRIHVRNRPHCRSLDTHKTKDAEKRAKVMIDQSKSHRWNQFLQVTNHKSALTLTLDELLEAYTTAAKHLEIKDTTAYKNKLSLRHILKDAQGNHPDGSLPLHRLITTNTVNDWKTRLLEQIQHLDGETQTRRKRSANSTLTQARAVFSRHILDFYERHLDGWETTPAITKFLTTPKFRKTRKLTYHPPSDDVIAATFADLPALLHTNRNAYTALWLAIGFGLRKSEIIAARSDWFITRDGTTYLRADYIDKGGESLDIPCQNGAWEALQPVLADLNPGDPMLSGLPASIEQILFRKIGAWLTERGWTTQKKIHELRAWAGCQVGNQYGILVCSQWMRHKEISTTQQYYGRYLNMKSITTPSIQTLDTQPATPTNP